MKLYYSDVLSPHKACAVARYLKSPVEFVYLDLVKGEQQAPACLSRPQVIGAGGFQSVRRATETPFNRVFAGATVKPWR